MKINWLYYASPRNFDRLAARLVPYCAFAAALCAVCGLIVGLEIAPTDAVQGDAYRIIFIHVPAAWMSMLIYLVMAVYGLIELVLNVRLAGLLVRALAPTGTLFTVLALVSGSLWGRPTWGTYWVWDARLTSELILLFLYCGLLLLQGAIGPTRRGDRAGALLVVIGVVNIPIIYFSVQWWNTLHQGASISLSRGASMAPAMLAGLLLMTAAAWLYAIAVVLARARRLIAARREEPAAAAQTWSIHPIGAQS
jgi:heme exporter protein C